MTVYTVSYAYDDFSSTGFSLLAAFATHTAAVDYVARLHIRDRKAGRRAIPDYDAAEAPINDMIDPAYVIQAHTVHESALSAPIEGDRA